jgi:ParB/RepB/Spo0J family partition protein
MAKSKEPLVTSRKGDYFWVDSRRLVFEDGYNDREDYGDIETLAAQIEAQGVKQPLKGYRRSGGKDNETWVVKSGHRRTMACRLLEKKGIVIIVPVFPVPKGESPEEKVLDLITENDALPLTPWEKTKVVKRLRNFGWTEDDIAGRSGLSKEWVKSLLLLADSPQRLIELVRKGTVTATFAISTIKKGTAEVQLLIEKGEAAATPIPDPNELFPHDTFSGKAPRVTQADVRPNSWKLFKKWSQKFEEEIAPEKIDFLEFLKKMMDGKLTEKDFKKFFR